MAAAMKFVFVIVAITCCMQLVEMHRFRRDEPIAHVPQENVAQTIETLLTTIKENIVKSPVFQEISENMKNIKPEDAANLLEKLGASVKENLGNAETFVKTTLENINKEAVSAKTD